MWSQRSFHVYLSFVQRKCLEKLKLKDNEKRQKFQTEKTKLKSNFRVNKIIYFNATSFNKLQSIKLNNHQKVWLNKICINNKSLHTIYKLRSYEKIIIAMRKSLFAGCLLFPFTKNTNIRLKKHNIKSLLKELQARK